MEGKNREIERLRGIAILMVFVSHFYWLAGKVHPAWLSGATGVDIFFVVSGYVVSRSLFRLLPEPGADQDLLARFRSASGAVKEFYARRFFRIMPLAALWAALPLALAVAFGTEGGAGKIHPSWAFKELLAVLTFQYNYGAIYKEFAHPILQPYWSLSVEEHFYLLFPLFLLMIPRDAARLRAAILGILGITFVVRPLVPFSGPHDDVWLWYQLASQNRFDSMLLGAAIALVQKGAVEAAARPEPHAGRWAPNALCLALVGALWVMPAYLGAAAMKSGYTASIAFRTLASGILVYLASRERGWVFGMAGLRGALEYVGSRSYGIYLIHQPVQHAIDEVAHRMGVEGAIGARIALMIAATAVLAELCYRLIERPAIAYGRRWAGRAGARAEAEPGRSASLAA